MLSLASIDTLDAAQRGTLHDSVVVNTLWVVVAALLVLFMQAGFAMLEVGLSRMKNAGAVMGKILINLSIAFLMFWAVGFSLAFGTGNNFIGSSGWFMNNGNPGSDFASLAYSDTNFEVNCFFQVVFCAVSLAIVFGAMLDRTKFIGYIIFAIVFTGFIYPRSRTGRGAAAGCCRTASRTSPARRSCTCRARWPRPRAPRAGAAHREVPRREARAHPRPLDPADHPRRDHPVGRLDGLQPGLVPERGRRELRRRRGRHQPGGAAGVIGRHDPR